MVSQKGLCWLLVAAVVLVACQSPPQLPPADLPPQQVTIVPHTGQSEYIVFVIDSVTPLRSGESGPNELVEFRLLVAATDEEGNYSGITYCPGNDPRPRNVGDEIRSPCGIKLAFSESDVADELYIYLLGVDEDEVSLLADIGSQVGSAVIAKGFVEAIKIFAKGGALSSGGVAFILETAVGIIGGKAAEYFQEEDIVGQHLFSLSRQAGWGVGRRFDYVTNDGGMRVNFHVDRATANGGVQFISIDESPDQPPPPTPPPLLPTPSPLPPPTPPPAFPQPIDRLVLFIPGGGDVMTLRDGDTIDLSRIGTSVLDIRVEADDSAGSILFSMDGRNLNLNGRNLENVPPFIIGGDIDGKPYGTWDWASLAGGTHTIRVWACSRPGGEGECAPAVDVIFTVQW